MSNTERARGVRREAAEVRQAACDKLSPQERIKKLDMLLGAGCGAVHERKRLAAMIQKTSEKVSTPSLEETQNREKPAKAKSKKS